MYYVLCIHGQHVKHAVHTNIKIITHWTFNWPDLSCDRLTDPAVFSGRNNHIATALEFFIPECRYPCVLTRLQKLTGRAVPARDMAEAANRHRRTLISSCDEQCVWSKFMKCHPAGCHPVGALLPTNTSCIRDAVCVLPAFAIKLRIMIVEWDSVHTNRLFRCGSYILKHISRFLC